MADKEVVDVLDEDGNHIGTADELEAAEKAAKEAEKAPEGLDENGNWIGISEEPAPPVKAEEPAKTDKKDEKKK